MTPDDLPDHDQPVDEFDESEIEADTLSDDFVRYEAIEAQNRLWIKAITPILQLRTPDAQGNVRVQFAFDRLQIAACERLTRILSADLPAVDS